MSQVETQGIEKKRQLQKVLESNFESWDETSEHAIQIVAKNEQVLVEIQELDQILTLDEKQAFSQQYNGTWKIIIEQHKQLLESIQSAQKDVKEQLNQVSKKNKVVNHYMDNQPSVFVDRDV